MRYQDERTDAELAAAEVERWQPVASSSRPHNYVPAGNHASQLPSTFWQPPSTDMQIWQPVDGVQEKTSAQDRAWGYNIRLLAPLGLAVVLALTGTVAFVVVMRWTATPVDGLVSFLVFLLCLAMTFGAIALHISSDDYRHSQSGVELARIEAAAQVKREENKQSFELRRRALDGYLKQIGVSDDE